MKRKALAFKPSEHNEGVHIFPWYAPVLENGELCSPRVIRFPGIPDHFLKDLPTIGQCFGKFVNCVGVIDSPGKNSRSKKVRDPFVSQRSSNNFKACLPDDCSDPCIIALVPNKWKLPAYVKLRMPDGVIVKQPIFEQNRSPSINRLGIRLGRCSSDSKSRRSDSTGSRADECIICWKYMQEQRVLLVPCGHTNLCRSCAMDLWVTSKRCPTCRQQMERKPFPFWM